MPAPQAVLDLIERFERNLDAYKSGSYNETQVRREFLDPFFEALGWDVNNCEGNAEAYKGKIRQYMTNHYYWQNMLHLPGKVFRAVVDTHVLVFEKRSPKTKEPVSVSVYVKNGRDIVATNLIGTAFPRMAIR
ncbi:MAG: type IIS restriction enzyme Eco57I [Geobacteraceae bacterium]|nr:MAG: type IIS restriction enzyme Eco57I [Geobacteraceae bacterium]